MKPVRPNSILPLILLTLALSVGALRAQDETRAVQEELRRRSLYFGDVDGRESAELREATKRYQRRKGFAATGRADRETLRSLGLLPRAPGEAPPEELDWPKEPVLPSDETIDSVEVAESLREETGIAPSRVVSKKVAKKRGLSSKTRRPRRGMAPVVDDSQPRPPDSPYITRQEVARFATDYVRAMGSNDIKRQLKFYADKVDYYHNGEIDRRIIEQTLRRYHARWPSRRYTMGTVVRYRRLSQRGEIVLVFPVAFTLGDGRRTVRGQTSNRLTISAATVDPRIVSISEDRIRR